EGFTYSIDQRLPLTDAPLFRSLSDPGEIELGLNVNQLRRLETSISGLGYDRNVAKGEINSPEWKAQFSLRYRNDAFSFAWFTNYVSSAEFDVTFTEEDRDIRKVGDYFKHDASVQYRPNEAWALRFVLNDVFDEVPPHPNAIGFLAQSGAYDVIGRNFVLGANLRFWCIDDVDDRHLGPS